MCVCVCGAMLLLVDTTSDTNLFLRVVYKGNGDDGKGSTVTAAANLSCICRPRINLVRNYDCGVACEDG